MECEPRKANCFVAHCTVPVWLPSREDVDAITATWDGDSTSWTDSLCSVTGGSLVPPPPQPTTRKAANAQAVNRERLGNEVFIMTPQKWIDELAA